MNLLLFLSAILSALTGVISGGRVVEVQVERSFGAVAQEQAGTIVLAAPTRAVPGWLSLADGWATPAIAVCPAVVAYALAAVAPLYLNKPRE